MKQKLLLALLALFTLGGSSLYAQTWTASEVGEGKALLYNVGKGQYFTRGNGYSTQASVGVSGEYSAMTVELIADGSNYKIRTAVNGTDFGVENLGETVYTDQSRNKVSTWTFTQVSTDNGPVYTIVSADNHSGGSGAYMTASADNTIVGPGTDGSSEYAKWKIYLIEDQKTKVLAAMPNATESSPVDVSVLIGNNQFSTALAPVVDQAWSMNASNQNLSGGNLTNNCAESWKSAFTLSQTITVLNGYYKARAQAFVREYDETGTDYPVVYLDAATKPFKKMVTETASLGTVSDYFKDGTDGGYWTDWTDVVTVTSKSITIGVRGTRTNTWCAWDNFQLQYLGPIDLSEYITGLANAVAAAQAYESQLPAAVYANIASVITEYNKEYEDGDGYSTAIQAINNAVSTYASDAIVADYTRYKNIRTAVLAINPRIDVSAANKQVEEATTTAGIDAAILTLRNALTAYLPTAQLGTGETIDLTDALIDNAAPGISGTLDYWTNSGSPTLEHQLYEYWNASGATTKQVLASTLPVGNYKLTAIAYTRNEMKSTLNAGNNSINLVGCGSVNDRTQGDEWIAQGNGENVLVFSLAKATADIEIGLTADDTTSDHWMCWRSFRLVYGDVFEPYTLVEGKMNADVATAQTAAKNTFEANKTIDNYSALLAAIAAAQASKNAYEHAKAELNKIVEELEGTNVYTAAVYEANVTDNLTAYENGTLTDAEANAITMLASWHGANTIDDILMSAWDANVEDWDGLHVNTWSPAGDFEETGFVVPLVEYWVGSGSLTAKTMTATIPGLEAGNYKVSANMFVKASTTPTGVSMQVGDAEAAAITGTQSGSFFVSEATAFGTVGEDGNLVIKLIVAEGNNTNWVGFKNMKYEKVTVDYAALNAAIANANAVNSTIDGGVKALTDAIAVAEALLSSTNQDDIDAGVTTLNAAIEDAQATIVARKNLAGVAKKAKALKSFLNTDITEAINEATQYAANAEATAEEANNKANVLSANFAEWEIISINNGTFDTGLNGELIEPGTEAKPYVHAVDGWTQNFKFSSTASQGIAAAYGSAAQDGTNGTAAPEADMFGKSEGGTLHLSSGWSDQARYYQVVENLPAGKYVFYYEGYNANNTTNTLNSNYFGIGNLTAGDLEGTQNTFKYSDEKSFTYNEWKAVAFDFTLTKTIESANINVGLIGGTVGSASTPKMWFDNVTIYCIEKASERVTITVNKNASDADGYCYGTLYYSDKALVVPEGLTAYTYKVTDGTLSESMTYETGDVIPAATGVVVKTANNSLTENASFDFIVTAESGETDSNNMLHGTDEAEMTNAGEGNWKYYALSLNSSNAAGTVGFYFRKGCPNGEAFQNSAHKAYLAVPVAQAKGMSGFAFGGETDGIGQLENAELTMENATIYNLAGQKVNNTQKGVYIMNGKKVVVK